MSDPETAVDDPEAGDGGEPKTEVTVESLMDRLTTLEAKESAAMSDNAGLQRKNTELLTKVEELEKRGMSEEKRFEYEREQFTRDRDAFNIAKKEHEVSTMKRDLMDEMGVDRKFEKRIFGETREEIVTDIQSFKNTYDSDVKTHVNETLVSGGEAAAKSGKAAEGQKTLENHEDGLTATREQQRAYMLEQMEK